MTFFLTAITTILSISLSTSQTDLTLEDGCIIPSPNYDQITTYLSPSTLVNSTSLDLTNTPFTSIIGSNNTAPIQTESGWQFNQSNPSTPTPSLITWFFNSIDFNSPDYLYPQTTLDTTLSLNSSILSTYFPTDFYTLSCLNQISISIKGTVSSLSIRVYTQPSNDSNLNAGSFYRSSFLVSANTLGTVSDTFNDFSIAVASLPNDFEPVGIDGSQSIAGDYESAKLEEILGIAIETDEDDSGNDFIIGNVEIIYGCRYDYVNDVADACAKYVEVRQFDLSEEEFCDYNGDNMDDYIGEEILPIDAENKVDILDFYESYCVENEDIEWRKGVEDGTLVLTQDDLNNGEDEIDYQLFFCLFGLYDTGYVLLNPDDGSPLDCDSGVTIGGGIDLGHLSRNQLESLDIDIPNDTLSSFDPYYLLLDIDAAISLCENGPLDLSPSYAYDLSLDIIESLYLAEIQERYNSAVSSSSSTTNTTWSDLTKGVKTVLTVMYSIHGDNLFDYSFWDEIINQEYSDAIVSLNTWSSFICYTDKILYQYLANILSASIECEAEVDIVFLIDGSGSVTSNDFDSALDFIIDIVKNYDEFSNVRFGVSQFSTEYQTEFYLNTYINSTKLRGEGSIIRHIRDIVQIGELTYLADAMEHLSIDQFNVSNGMRRNQLYIPRFAIIMTDGLSRDGVSVSGLESIGVDIVAIGIGQYDIDQLNEISNNIYELDDYSELTTVISDITGDSCLASSELDTDNGESDEIDCNQFETKYYRFNRRRGRGWRNKKRFKLNINQNKGCVYIYISECNQYPSFYTNRYSHTVCWQDKKYIVIESVDYNDTQSCSDYDNDSSSSSSSDDRRRARMLLQTSDSDDNSEDGGTVYISIEGIDVDNNYTIELEECYINDTSGNCEIGSNEEDIDDEIENQCVVDGNGEDYLLLEDEDADNVKNQCESKENERDCVGYFSYCLWINVNVNKNNDEEGLSDVGIAMIVVASVLFVIGIIVVAIIFIKKRNEHKEQGISSVSATIVNSYKSKGKDKQDNIVKAKPSTH